MFLTCLVEREMNRLYAVSSFYHWRQEMLFCMNLELHFVRQFLNYSSLSLNSSIFKKLRDGKPVQQVHAKVIVSGNREDIFYCNSVMNAYASWGRILAAQIVFSHIPRKNLVSWTILISGFVRNCSFLEGIEAFHGMIREGIRPNAITVATVLPAFGKLKISQMGKSVHCYWIKLDFAENVFVDTALIHMYSKFGCIDIARLLFDRMPVRNTVSWNAIIAAYSENGNAKEALWMFSTMRREGIFPDIFTIMSLVSGCLGLLNLEAGKGIHGLTISSGYENDHLVKTSLLDLYIDGELVHDAHRLFSEISKKDVVSWTLMLKGIVQSFNMKEATEHFTKMLGADNISLDSGSYVTILSGCSSAGALQQGKRIHGLVIKTGFESDMFLGSSVIDMYANCANVEDAAKCFESMEWKDTACWNSLLSGYGMNGYGQDALDLFLKMKQCGIDADESTFVSVLCACSHSGLVDEGLEIFNEMQQVYRKTPSAKHYACVIDLLGRVGRLNDAYTLMTRMTVQPGIEVYSTLLSSCRTYKNLEIGGEICRKVVELEQKDPGCCMLMLDMYALAGNWDGVRRTRKFMRWKNVEKDPGCSSIEVNGEVYVFKAGQKGHPEFSKWGEGIKDWILKVTANAMISDEFS